MTTHTTTQHKPSIQALIVVWAIIVAIDSTVCYYLGVTLDLGFYLCMVVALVFIIFVARTDILNR